MKTTGNPSQGTAGEAITAGQSVYLDSSTQKYKLALAAGTVDQAGATGVALNGAALNQPIFVLGTGGTYNPGAVVAIGQVYAVGAVAGTIVPVADLASTNFVTLLGIATTAALLVLNVNASGIAKA